MSLGTSVQADPRAGWNGKGRVLSFREDDGTQAVLGNLLPLSEMILASLVLRKRSGSGLSPAVQWEATMDIRRTTAAVILTLVAMLPVESSAAGIELRIGGFFPRANTGSPNDLFVDDSVLYTVGKGDWTGVTGGIEFNVNIAPQLEVGLHLDGYSRTAHTYYRDYQRPSGREITQSLQTDIIPLGLSLRLVPGGRRGRVAPYVAVGADFFFWEYEEWGEFIDFEDRTLPIIEDSFQANGVAPGFHVAAGIRIPINYDIGIVAEGKYQWAEDDMGDDFRGNRIDLSGPSATIGVSIRF
jgi:hypothetical protein